MNRLLKKIGMVLDLDNDSIILELVPETQDVEIIKVSAPKRKLQMPITHFFKKPKDSNL